jgi:hypothetical protein
MVLKLDSRVDSRQGPGHISKGSTRIDMGQHKIKMLIIKILKPNLRNDQGKATSHRSRGSTRVYPS